MKENKGHARCNAFGLKYASEKEDFDYIIAKLSTINGIGIAINDRLQKAAHKIKD